MIDFADVRAVTFDCYGTLVDWEAGIRAFVAPQLETAARQLEVRGAAPPVDEWIARWEANQFAMLAPYRPYRDILVESYDRTMRDFGLAAFADAGPGLVRSVADWPPFPDTARALRRLARRRQLAIVSNIDNDLLSATLGRLLVPLAVVVSAEDARAYKPDEAPFRLALERLGLPASSVLHAAFGWRYDLATARRLGMRTCWVNRRGEPRPEALACDVEVRSLDELANVADPT